MSPSFSVPVSVCVIAYNEEAMIVDCLESAVGYAAEIVCLDAESQDHTRSLVESLAKSHPEIVLISAPNQENFDRNKTLTFEQATQPWIFYLDADERMTPALWEEIAATIAHTSANGFRVGRKNMYFGQWMQHGGMYPEKQPRLFRRGKGKFPGKGLHETLVISGEIGELQEPFIHYAYSSVQQFIAKLQQYTGVQATVWYRQGVRWSTGNHWRYGIARPAGRFLQKYFWLHGFRDGFLGFFVAWMAGVNEFVTYMKIKDHV